MSTSSMLGIYELRAISKRFEALGCPAETISMLNEWIDSKEQGLNEVPRRQIMATRKYMVGVIPVPPDSNVELEETSIPLNVFTDQGTGQFMLAVLQPVEVSSPFEEGKEEKSLPESESTKSEPEKKV